MARAMVLGMLMAALALSGCMSAYASAMANGDALGQKGRWDEAARSYEQALRERPGDAEARTHLRVARWNQSQTRAARAQALLAQGDALGALRVAREAIDIDSAVPETQAVFDEALSRALASVDALEASGRGHEALETLAAIRRLDPTNARAAQMEAGLRGRLAEAAYARAEGHLARQRPGNALLALREATRIRPGYRDADARAEAIQAKLTEELRFHLVVPPQPEAPGLTRAMVHGLLRWESDAQRPLLRAVEAPPPGAQGAQITPSLGPITRAHDVRAEPRSCMYVCGVDVVPNPAFGAARLRVTEAARRAREADDEAAQARRALREAQSLLDTASAESTAAERGRRDAERDLSACQRRNPAKTPCSGEEKRARDARRDEEQKQSRRTAAEAAVRRATETVKTTQSTAEQAKRSWDDEVTQLGRTPSTLSQERTCAHSYGVEIHTLTARTTSELQAQGLGKPRPSPLLPHEIAVSARDETFAAQPNRCAQVAAGDPLALPNDGDLDDRLGSKALQEARTAVRAWYDAYARAYLDESEQARLAGRPEDAAEARVRHALLVGKAPEG